MPSDEREIETAVLDSHEATVRAVIDAGRAVVSGWTDETVGDSDRIVVPLQTILDEQGLSARLLDVLTSCVDATETTLKGAPIATPPYLVVTGRGPICRGTLADGRRLVLELELFEIEHRPPAYRFRDPTPRECLTVSFAEHTT